MGSPAPPAARSDQRAGQLFGAVAALRAALGAPRPLADGDGYRRAIALARTTLGDDAFTAAESAGRALPLEEAIVVALAVVDELA